MVGICLSKFYMAEADGILMRMGEKGSRSISMSRKVRIELQWSVMDEVRKSTIIRQKGTSWIEKLPLLSRTVDTLKL